MGKGFQGNMHMSLRNCAVKDDIWLLAVKQNGQIAADFCASQAKLFRAQPR
jgi:hypothetical protein